MRDVARVNYKRRRLFEGIDFIDRLLECFRDFVIWILIEPDVTVTDLREGETAFSFHP
jgi:hypothetical protein